MGTTYHIKIVTDNLQKISGLKEKIDKRLEEINKSMSTYRKESEISRFNALKVPRQKFKISLDFAQVIMESKKLYMLTGGAWDGSMYPLVNLWGFGKSERKKIFKKFYQVGQSDDMTAKGSGLGLYLVHSIAGLHKGKVVAESNGIGKGSAFILILPFQTA